MLAIRNGYILTLDEQDHVFDKGDLLVEENRIRYVGPRLEFLPPEARVIDAAGKLIMPGLINVHAHSNELLVRGRLDNMPLELGILYVMPPIGYGPFSERLMYLRTMLGAIEMLKTGVTAVQDDVSETPRTTLAGAAAVRQAYADSGMRANVTCNQGSIFGYEQYPWFEELFPQWFIDESRSGEPFTAKELLDLNRTVIDQWHGAANGRLRMTLSFSAPQRGSIEYLQGMNDLSEKCNLPLHMHILETKVQRVTGDLFYGKSMIKYANELGLITPRTTIIHAVWLDDEDMAILGNAHASVAHNPISNLKLVSGIMPLRRMIRAGVNVGLGTDGASSNDSFNSFELMKLTANLHKLTSLDFDEYPTAQEVVGMATVNGARSMMIDHEVGRLAPGYKADMVLLNKNAYSFTPFNDPYKHLVYCENGANVESVMVDGEEVVRDHRLIKVDEEALLSELRERVVEHDEIYQRCLLSSDKLYPSFEKMYRRAMAQDVGMDRLALPKN